jgi:peptide/nickel transport system substrate-binding protein
VKQQLATAGYAGERVALMVPTDFPILKALSDVTAEMLRKAGMNVDYQAIDWGTVVQRRSSKKPPDRGGWNLLCTFFLGLDFLSPATHLPLRGNGQQGWFGWPTSPNLEALHDRWFDAADLTEQKKLCVEIQIQAFTDTPYYPLGLAYTPTAFRSDLTGVLDGLPLFLECPSAGVRRVEWPTAYPV